MAHEVAAVVLWPVDRCILHVIARPSPDGPAQPGRSRAYRLRHRGAELPSLKGVRGEYPSDI